MRGNAVALVVGGLLLVGLLLLPNLTPPPETPPPVDLAHGRIVAFMPELDDPTLPDVVIEVLQGPPFGTTLPTRSCHSPMG